MDTISSQDVPIVNTPIVPAQPVQRQPKEPQRQPTKISIAPTTTFINSHFPQAIPSTVNFSVQSPMVTIAPMTSQPHQLILPAKLIKSESVVYSATPRTTTAPMPHQIHTLVNAPSGTVFTTGKQSVFFISKRNLIYLMTLI